MADEGGWGGGGGRDTKYFPDDVSLLFERSLLTCLYVCLDLLNVAEGRHRSGWKKKKDSGRMKRSTASAARFFSTRRKC